MAKQESLSAETVDWKVVVDLSQRILQDTSKDLLVGSYLCNALLITEGYTGLAVGLNVLNEMVAELWDDLFPPLKRMRARQSAMSWLAEKAGAHVAANPPTAADAAAVIEAADRLKDLDNALVEKMGDQAPLLTDLLTPLKNHRKSAEAEAARADQASAEKAAAEQAASEPTAQQPTQASAQPVAEPTVSTSAPEPAAPATAAPAPALAVAVPKAGAPGSEADSKKVIRQLQTSTREIAAFWLSQKLSDPRAYRLSRVAVWMAVDSPPPNNNGVTQINPPAAERLKFFEVQQEKGDHAALIPELEKTLARSPFWIDGHFTVVKSLRVLGGEYEMAAMTVIGELGSFLRRMPDVLELAFADETAFVGDQARMWLDAEVLNQGGEAGDSTESTAAAGEPWSLALAQAKKLAASGDADPALNLLNDGLAQAGQMRDQYYWRCAIAELLLQVGKAEAAATILEALSAQSQSRQIADWEPRLMSKIYHQLFLSYQKQKKAKKDDQSLKDKTEQAFEQLCWFDPLTALSLKGG